MSISTQITVVATAEQIIVTAPGALRGPQGIPGPEGDVTPEVTQLVEDAQAAADAATTAKDGAQQSATLSEGFKDEAETAAEAAAAQLAPVTEQAGLAAVAADRSESSASMSAAASNPFPSTADGIASTSGSGSTNRYFSVPGTGSTLSALYRNDAGVAIKIGEAPSLLVVSELQSTTVSARKSVNLVNQNDADVAIGFRPNYQTGALTAVAGYNTTAFIPVTAGLPYSLSSRNYLVWYSSEKQYISGTTDSETALTVTAPSGAAFMRASAKTSAPNLWAGFQVEQGPVPTQFESYGKFLKESEIKKGDLSGGSLSVSSLPLSAAQFISPSKNLYNKFSARIGYSINATTGTETANATYNLSDFIPITAGQAYYGAGANPVRFSCFYDSNKNFVIGGSNTSVSTFVAPATAAFIKISIFAVDHDVFQLEAGSAPTAFTPYAHTLTDPTGAPLNAIPAPKALLSSMYADASVLPEKTNFLQKSKNLFNKSSVTAGYQMSMTGGLTANATFNLSDFIPVTPGVQYFGANPVNSIRFHCFFTEGKSVLAGGSNSVTNTFTPPAGAAFVRITVYAADQDAFQLEVGSSATSYERFGYKLSMLDNTPIEVPSTGVSSGWISKIVAGLGDSITAQNKWPPYVMTALGCVFVNYGVGGTKLSGAAGDANAMCQDARINAIPTTIDALTLLAGTNDWAQNIVLGSVDSSDPLTFNGAFNAWAAKAMARWPAKRMIILTTPYGELPDFASRGWANAFTNSQGLTTRDYAKAIQDQAKRWGFPCIDINGCAGWNTLNIRTFITDDGGLLHPNDAGGKRIAEVVVGAFKNISPV